MTTAEARREQYLFAADVACNFSRARCFLFSLSERNTIKTRLKMTGFNLSRQIDVPTSFTILKSVETEEPYISAVEKRYSNR